MTKKATRKFIFSYLHINSTRSWEKFRYNPQNFQQDFKSKLTPSLLKTIWLGLWEGGCYKHPHSIPPRHHRHQHHHDYYYHHHYYHAGSSHYCVPRPRSEPTQGNPRSPCNGRLDVIWWSVIIIARDDHHCEDDGGRRWHPPVTIALEARTDPPQKWKSSLFRLKLTCWIISLITTITIITIIVVITTTTTIITIMMMTSQIHRLTEGGWGI